MNLNVQALKELILEVRDDWSNCQEEIKLQTIEHGAAAYYLLHRRSELADHYEMLVKAWVTLGLDAAEV